MRLLPGTIRGRVIALVAAVSVPLIAVLTWGFVDEVSRERASARATALRIARSIAGDVRDANGRAHSLLTNLAERPKIRRPNPADCDTLFAIVDLFPQYPTLLLYDSQANIVCSAAPSPADLRYTRVAEPEIVRAIRTGAFSLPSMILARDRWILVTYQTVVANGRPVGVLALPQYFDFSTQAYPAGTVLTISDANRRIMARSRDAEKWVGKTGSPTVATRLAARQEEGMVESRGVDGISRDYGFKRVDELGWRVFVGIPTSATIAPVRELLVRGLSVGALIIVLVAVFAQRITRTIEQPLGVLAHTVSRAAQPGFKEQVPIGGPLEVDVVARAFNEMVRTRAEAERALVESTAQLAALSNKLLEVQEEERSRIAREIHDELGQLLTALNMDIGGLLGSVELPPEQRAMARRIRQALGETLSSVQRISAELRPAILDDFGLIAAIELELQKYEQRTGIECDLSAPPDLKSLGRDIDSAIFRIVQEAMTNIARHANATRLEVRLRTRGDEWLVEIRDDGGGIAEKVIHDRASIGLIGMRERARSIGATVEIEGIAGQGTIVSLRVPLAAVEAQARA